MAVTAGTTWHIVPVASYAGASDNNGGGFNPAAAGTSYAYGASMPAAGGPILALTDLACTAASTTVTSASPPGGGFTAAMIGNLLKIVSGTNALAGWYEIKTRSDANTITIDRTCATGGNMTDGVGNVGGALASPGVLTTCWASTTVAASSQFAYAKAGTYVLASATPGTGGPISIIAAFRCRIEGYDIAFDDRGGFAVLDAGAQTNVVLVTLANTASATRQLIASVKVDGKSGAGNNGFDLTDPENRAYKCWAVNCDQAVTNYGFSNGQTLACYSLDTGIGFTLITKAVGDVAKSCTANGFNLGTNSHALIDCIADDNAGDGFTASSASQIFTNCSAYSNGGAGFDLSAAADISAVNCVSTDNGTYGFTTVATSLLVNCATYNNTSGRASGTTSAPLDINPITCTGSPFMDAAGADFRPDATAAEGMYLRAAGLGPYGQTNAADIGAMQHNGEATQKALDAAFLTANKDEMIAANDSIVAEFGCDAGTAAGGGGIDPGDIVAAAFVVVGHDNYVGGDAGTYPTEATSKAAQLVDDKAAITAGKADILSTRTILTITGTFDLAANDAGVAAAQLVTDQGVVLAAAASIKDDATILGQDGTYDFTAAIAAGYASGEAAQLAADQVAVGAVAASISDTVTGLLGTVNGTLDLDLYTLISGVVAASHVRYGTARYSGGSTGTAYIPAAADVQFGVAVDATTGTFVVPDVSIVLDGEFYGAGGTEFEGTLEVTGGSSTDPGVGNVEAGVTYTINSAAKVGTFVVPSTANVCLGTLFGADGTEFTGTYSAGFTDDNPVPPEPSDGSTGGDVIADLIDSMRANHGLELLVEDRIYGGVVPVGVVLPFVWLQRRGVEYVGALEGEDEPWKEFFDIECVSDNGATVVELSDAVRAWERDWTKAGTFVIGDHVYSALTVQDAAETYMPRNVDAAENLFISSLDLEVARP